MAMGFYFKSFEHTTTQHSADNFFWKVGLISLIGLFTKMAKKMRRFFGHPGHIFGQILELYGWARVSYGLKCAP